MKKLSLFLVVLTIALISCKPEAEKPTVVTKSVGEVANTSAKVVGQVAADGGAEVTERGICWNQEETPTVIDYRVEDKNSGLGSYDIVITDLIPNTQYFVRAYAINESGVGYGEEKTFTTLGDEPEQPVEGAPVVKTAEVTEIKLFSAICGGEVISSGDADIIARGICWSITQKPTIEDNCTTDGIGTGSYTSSLADLNYGTTYYVRAYATNELGTGYGEEKIFTTLPIEGTTNGYAWVNLGLPSGKKWASCNVGANSPEEYGEYFAWGEASAKETYTEDNSFTYGLTKSQMQSQGCIDGEGNLTPQYDAAAANCGGNWRMPTKAEQDELLNNCTWTWTRKNGVAGYNVEGPSGASIFLPAAGYRLDSLHYREGARGYYWPSTPSEYGNTTAFYIFFDSIDYYVQGDYRYYGQSVRPILE